LPGCSMYHRRRRTGQRASGTLTSDAGRLYSVMQRVGRCPLPSRHIRSQAPVSRRLSRFSRVCAERTSGPH
jgi:hypothetical protein